MRRGCRYADGVQFFQHVQRDLNAAPSPGKICICVAIAPAYPASAQGRPAEPNTFGDPYQHAQKTGTAGIAVEYQRGIITLGAQARHKFPPAQGVPAVKNMNAVKIRIAAYGRGIMGGSQHIKPDIRQGLPYRPYAWSSHQHVANPIRTNQNQFPPPGNLRLAGQRFLRHVDSFSIRRGE